MNRSRKKEKKQEKEQEVFRSISTYMQRTPRICSSMSASDLAPFVAAVIEDGIATELQRQNAELQQEIAALKSTIQDRDEERLLVQITGRHGRPIYGATSLKHGRPELDMFDRDISWVVNIDNCICPLDEESITQLEIRVGGMLIMPRMLDQSVPILLHYEHEDEDDLDKLVYLDKVKFVFGPDQLDDDDDPPITRLTGRVGPITVRHANVLWNMQNVMTEIFTRYLFEQNVLPPTGAVGAQPTARNLTLVVTKIEFYKKGISGCISLLKQLDIRTLVPPEIDFLQQLEQQERHEQERGP